jgi:hypothetical protein
VDYLIVDVDADVVVVVVVVAVVVTCCVAFYVVVSTLFVHQKMFLTEIVILVVSLSILDLLCYLYFLQLFVNNLLIFVIDSQ